MNLEIVDVLMLVTTVTCLQRFNKNIKIPLVSNFLVQPPAWIQRRENPEDECGGEAPSSQGLSGVK